MKMADGSRFVLGILVLSLSIALWGGYLLASPGGFDGRCASSSGCGGCHGSSPDNNGDVTVSLDGPTTVATGTTQTYTVSVSGGPSGSRGGFNLCASSGSLVPGTGSELQGDELTHSSPDNRSWTFEWTAPPSGTSATFTAVGLTAGSGGESWDWLGEAAGATFDIVLEAPMPVLPATWGLLKAKYD